MDSATLKVMFSSESDEHSTPQDLFNELNIEFNFTLDVCATPENAKCSNYFTREQDGLKRDWLCDCFANYVLNAKKLNLLNYSGIKRECEMESIPTAKTVLDLEPEVICKDAEKIPLLDLKSLNLKNNITNHNMEGSKSANNPTYITISDKSELENCPGYGLQNLGMNALNPGAVDVPIVGENSPNLLKTTLSQQTLRLAQERSRGISCQRVKDVISQKEMNPHLNGEILTLSKSQVAGCGHDISNTAVYCNPPYGRGESKCKILCNKKRCKTRGWHREAYLPGVGDWVEKCYNTAQAGRTVVMLLPARVDTKWFHKFIYNRESVEIRFIEGRLKFGDAENTAPFPSMVVVFRGYREDR